MDWTWMFPPVYYEIARSEPGFISIYPIKRNTARENPSKTINILEYQTQKSSKIWFSLKGNEEEGRQKEDDNNYRQNSGQLQDLKVIFYDI